MFTRIDALLLPTAPFTPTLADLEADPIAPNSRLGTFTNFVNLCDLAAIAVPAGMGPDGLPTSVTLIGPGLVRRPAGADRRPHPPGECHADSAIPAAPLPPPAAAGRAGAGRNRPVLHRRPYVGPAAERPGDRARRPAPAPGSHHRGDTGSMPWEIAPAWCAWEGGGCIEGEVWALPTTAVGALLAKVPAPLGFGTVLLESGPCLGFQAESAGVSGMPDITELGGWRAYLAS